MKMKIAANKESTKELRSKSAKLANYKKSLLGIKPNKIRNIIKSPNEEELFLAKILNFVAPKKFLLNTNGNAELLLGISLYKTPDFISRDKQIILLHGCYWHNCPYHIRSRDKMYMHYWSDEAKKEYVYFVENSDSQYYKELGYDVLIIWEHELFTFPLLEARYNDALNLIQKIRKFNGGQI